MSFAQSLDKQSSHFARSFSELVHGLLTSICQSVSPLLEHRTTNSRAGAIRFVGACSNLSSIKIMFASVRPACSAPIHQYLE